MNMHSGEVKIWKPCRDLILEHLREAGNARRRAQWMGNGYKRVINKQAARYMLELARRERLGMYGVYGVHWGKEA